MNMMVLILRSQSCQLVQIVSVTILQLETLILLHKNPSVMMFYLPLNQLEHGHQQRNPEPPLKKSGNISLQSCVKRVKPAQINFEPILHRKNFLQLTLS
jgi:hypothetical protein